MRRTLPLQINFSFRRINMCQRKIPENTTDSLELQFRIHRIELHLKCEAVIGIHIIITQDIGKELLYRRMRNIFEEDWWNKSSTAYWVRHHKSVHILIRLYEAGIMPSHAHHVKLFHMRWRPNLIRIMRNNPNWKKELEKKEENTPSTSNHQGNN